MATSSVTVLHGFAPPVPGTLAQRAAAFSPDGRPARPAGSASVVLLRDAAGGPAAERVEVYLLHRHARMPFAPSVAVFPGGRIDPVDYTRSDPVLACACRETEEETGVRLDPGALRRWAHWITPECEPSRFDTHFYVVRLPAGAEPADVSGETDRAGWISATGALASRERGELALMPPTWAILTELAAAADVAAILRAALDRKIETIRPRLTRTGRSWAYQWEVLPS